MSRLDNTLKELTYMDQLQQAVSEMSYQHDRIKYYNDVPSKEQLLVLISRWKESAHNAWSLGDSYDSVEDLLEDKISDLEEDMAELGRDISTARAATEIQKLAREKAETDLRMLKSSIVALVGADKLKEIETHMADMDVQLRTAPRKGEKAQ